MISSVTVTYNPDIACLRNQLQSLMGQVDCCIIVDNGSLNIIEIEGLYKEFSFDLIRLEKNFGLACAQNVGINHAVETKGADYLLLLDQDSILEPDFISNLLSVYQQNNVGILGASFYDPNSGEIYPGTSYNGPFISRVPVQEFSEVTFVIASGSFFSSDVFKKVGRMEEQLFVDYIDVEWSLRAKSMGYVVAMTNKAKMAHTIGDARLKIFGRTMSVHSALRRYYLVRNSFFMLRLSYIPLGYKIRELFLNILRAVISFFASKNKKQVLNMVFAGFRDGLSNKYGEYTPKQ
ncbi:glycosyltransferase family 2 protein [Pseudescherichia vulneris]|uniref:glycosyltransferase family 2 protein n=1 Tax=Pseudescherichia vulneris TaxID=566 RepID=UPI0028ADE93B|nr:glycosyltransferase family 2 protein [Pseudescherichia vulneris]